MKKALGQAEVLQCPRCFSEEEMGGEVPVMKQLGSACMRHLMDVF